ncbi:MAG TPA: amidohydrolase family protein [Rhizomicrobium sp.]|nr:amidohydrolase family protein [Rhizomicrobium sp.]
MVVGAGLALSATSAWSQETRLTFEVPDGACDCHHHIYDPRFPYLPDARKQAPATVADYRIFQKKMGTSRDVIVLPSAYGTNNQPLYDFLAATGNVTRAIGVMHADVPMAEMKKLDRAGVRGVRIQFSGGGKGFFKREEIPKIAAHIAPLGWHIQFHMPGPLLAELEPVILALPTPVVVDHMAHASSVDQPQYKTMRKLLDTGRGWIKVSGINMDSKVGPPGYDDTSAVARSYMRAAPERVVWGSNWPFPGEHPPPDVVVLLNALAAQAQTRAMLHRVLVENPETLYGFDPAHRPKATG